MAKMITGRKLGGDGHPIDGTGFEYDSDGRLAALIAQRASPIYSQPITGEWVFGLVRAQNAGPSEHFHPTYDEHFEIVQGEFVFTINGQERAARAGDQLLVEKGTPHRFRCVGGDYGAVIVETRPAARTGDVIATLFGLAHEGALTPQGQPKFLQAMVIGSEYADDTVFTNPPPAIAIPIAKALAPLARLLGHRSSYEKYLGNAFWIAHVEQPGDRNEA